MKKLLSWTLTFLFLQSTFCFVLLPLNLPAQTNNTAQTQTSREPLTFGLQDGTPVRLRINRNMSSADAKTGDTVDFEVLEEVKYR